MVQHPRRPLGDVECTPRAVNAVNAVNAVSAFRAAKAAAALFLPRSCAVCDQLLDSGETGIACGGCWARLPLLPAPRCDRCGHPNVVGRCRWCDPLPPYVRAAR